jgi:hypothetical protein
MVMLPPLDVTGACGVENVAWQRACVGPVISVTAVPPHAEVTAMIASVLANR